ncbi:MAG TPA: DUF4397 domain-containing protein [Arachidicoccus sp.]|nr:DUF4397 domain-containing protein [Arachidicoccus sp.]
MKTICSLFSLFIVLMIWAACTKSSVTGNQAPTSVRLINAMPGKSFDLVLNDETLLQDIPYDSATAFLNGPSGFYKLLIHENGSNDTLINGNQYLQSGEKYSLFLLPDSANRVNGVKLSVVTDNADIPQFDSAKIRFFNFAPDTTSVSFVRLKRRGITHVYDTILPYLGIGRTYLDNSLNNQLGQYADIHIDTYLFEFLKTNDPGKLLDSMTLTIQRGKFYTFYYEGYDSLTTGPFIRKPVVRVSER